jgi:hypothetical protein
MNWAEAKEVTLFVIALWGAVLSTINWVQGRRKENRNVQITHGYRYVAFNDGSLGDAHLEIKATNAGQRPVSIVTLTLSTTNKKWLANSKGFTGMEDTPLPAILSDGMMASAFFRLQAIRSAMFHADVAPKVYLTPFAKDTLGNTYLGEPIEIDMAATD